uniref:Uncharacterized protein n=1 Tax=Medicago truncatula TaxID=3880 RepID=I3T9U1_MEDTR|nr:unknown [Medicago truncatula]
MADCNSTRASHGQHTSIHTSKTQLKIPQKLSFTNHANIDCKKKLLLRLDSLLNFLHTLNILLELANAVYSPVEKACRNTQYHVSLSFVCSFLIAISLSSSTNVRGTHQPMLSLPVYIKKLKPSKGNNEKRRLKNKRNQRSQTVPQKLW